MKLVCQVCNHQLEVDDAKIPASGSFRVKCPKCSQPIHGRRPAPQAKSETAPPPPSRSPSPAAPPSSAPDSDMWERLKPFVESYVNERIEEFRRHMAVSPQQPAAQQAEQASESSIMEERRRALVCEPDAKVAQKITAVFNKMGFIPDTARTAKEAVKKIDENFYEIVSVTSSFPDDASGGKTILNKINAQKMGQRRRVFAVLLSPSVATAGPANAFLQGANLTVNPADIGQLENLVRQGRQEFQKLFQ